MGEQRDRMLRGELYLASDPELVAAHRRAADLLHRLNSTATPTGPRVPALFRAAGLNRRQHHRLTLLLRLRHAITITARCFVNTGAVVLDCADGKIGDDVQMGPGVSC
jgi:maltose O-acetyltransferase